MVCFSYSAQSDVFKNRSQSHYFFLISETLHGFPSHLNSSSESLLLSLRSSVVCWLHPPFWFYLLPFSPSSSDLQPCSLPVSFWNIPNTLLPQGPCLVILCAWNAPPQDLRGSLSQFTQVFAQNTKEAFLNYPASSSAFFTRMSAWGPVYPNNQGESCLMHSRTQKTCGTH